MERLEPDSAGIERAAELLRQGQLVAFPTETVYGLGGDAANPDAVRRIFAAKGRPADHPVIVHLPEAAAIDCWAAPVPEAARRLAEAFWPGPLTLVLPRRQDVDDIVTGGQNTIGLRMPSHPTALALLQAFDGGLAAPSANRFGHVSPTTAEHVIGEFPDGSVAAVITGGNCSVGVESTIVDLSSEQPRLLRPGMIPHAELEAILGEPLAIAADHDGPRASGRLSSHYAPQTAVRLADRAEILGALQSGKRTCVLGLGENPTPNIKSCLWVSMPTTPAAYARRLYAELRRADNSRHDLIIIEKPPAVVDWYAINDRLQRAAADS